VTQLRNTDSSSGSLTARSVVASTLLGTEPPRLPVRLLVRVGELFGITEGTIRTALSRMVASGELTSADGTYELTGPRLLERQARQSASRRAMRHVWHGSWVMAIVVSDRRAADARADLRAALESARLSELREGVWLRPDNLNFTWPAVVDEQCTIVHARDVDPSLVARLWPLEDWAERAEDLRRDMSALVEPLERSDTSALADGFVVSAAVLRHFQADPLLPEELLPRGWPGTGLRTEYDRFDTAYRALLREYFRIL
jgi:phenylacetic acid degradation operon negative regulatory protein